MQGNESYDRASLARGFATLCAALIVAAPAGALAAPTETVLHAFTGGSDGSNPRSVSRRTAPVCRPIEIAVAVGDQTGLAFELTPPAIAGGVWTETVLHAFTGGSDGSNPQAGLIAVSNG